MIGLAGPYDFLPIEANDLRAMFGPPARFPQSQPVRFARGDAAPMLPFDEAGRLLDRRFRVSTREKRTAPQANPLSSEADTSCRQVE